MRVRLAAILLSVSALVSAACADELATTTETRETTAATATTATTATTPDSSTEPPPTSAPEEPTTCGGALPAGPTTFPLTGGGAEHAVRVFVPEQAASAEILPTVISFHGLTFDGKRMLGYTGYEDLAAEKGFVVVHPDGLTTPDMLLLSLGRGWEIVPGLDAPERDDIAFAETLMDELVENWCADPDRIYVVGDSLGAFFVSSLVCEIPERIAAAASISAVYHSDTCEPASPVSYVAFHGTNDITVPYEAGGDTRFPEIADIFFHGMYETFAKFAESSECDPNPSETQVSDAATSYGYENCNGDVEMTFYKIEGLGHVWPGEQGDTLSGVDATTETWAFFDRHSRSTAG